MSAPTGTYTAAELQAVKLPNTVRCQLGVECVNSLALESVHGGKCYHFNSALQNHRNAWLPCGHFCCDELTDAARAMVEPMGGGLTCAQTHALRCTGVRRGRHDYALYMAAAEYQGLLRPVRPGRESAAARVAGAEAAARAYLSATERAQAVAVAAAAAAAAEAAPAAPAVPATAADVGPVVCGPVGPAFVEALQAIMHPQVELPGYVAGVAADPVAAAACVDDEGKHGGVAVDDDEPEESGDVVIEEHDLEDTDDEDEDEDEGHFEDEDDDDDDDGSDYVAAEGEDQEGAQDLERERR